ncbi:MAG TPA: 2-oxoglutarate dehydrogenase, E2 component, dihydrolipoamide succinyltransferase [Jatrophihabitantaceae bacterium]|jgi:2-oxoglutarate dehydrogenase E2 component (dihydrolipoamide succinyltransferase)
MSVSVTMPRLGESVTEGTVTRWLKNEGDHVEADEPLLEVSTDKVDTEVPSPASGTLTSIKVQEDETVEIGVELAVIGDDGAGGGAESTPAAAAAPAAPAQEAPAQEAQPQPAPAQEAPPQPAPQPVAQAAPPAPTAPAPAAPPAPQPSAQPAPPAAAPVAEAPSPNGAVEAGEAGDDDLAGTYVTPLVRKLASEHGVDLNSIAGTGVGGRIRKSDVLAAAERAAADQAEADGAAPAAAPEPAQAQPSAPEPVAATGPAPAFTPSAPLVSSTGYAPAPAAPSQTPAPAAVADAAPAQPAAPPAAAAARGRTEKMSRLRQTIATRMVESLQVSAQLTTVVEVDVTKIARLRERAKAAFEAREGVKLSFLPFFAVATVEALKAHPAVNSSIDTEAKTITYHDAEHLSIAVDTERGLVVPVIHNAGDLNLSGIARAIADLAERTRTNKISPDELSGGTFTLTNTGSRGALFDTPILNQPQVGILGTGAVVKRPVVVSDPELGETIAIRSMVYLALTYDHRIVDGADAARFLGTIKDRLEAGNFERALGLA